MERRLAAILFTDIVAYTALMARDEAAGRRVRARHDALVREKVDGYQGRWIEEKGDESLSIFPSALQAVDCALAIQAELRNDPELTLRIGVHLGDVTIEDGRVYGDGVNVASRIRPLAEPGGVAVSGPVYDSIKSQPGISAESKGEQTLKNVASPVAVWALSGTAGQPHDAPSTPRRWADPRVKRVAAGIAGAALLLGTWLVIDSRTASRPAASTSPIRSLAVLPLDDPTAGPDEAYFSFGMTEALIAELAKLEELRVISRKSVTPYEATILSLPKIAAELGVDGIIEGSIQRSGDRVRVTAQLIDARTDTHIWAESYDRDLGDYLSLQAEVAREIARQVQIKVLPPGETISASARPMSAEAYEAYLKGYYFVMKRTREGTLRALEYFNEVIRLEPDHPLGYSGLADEYSCVPAHSWSIADSSLWPSVPSEMIARARENAHKAVELDPLSGPAQNSLALIATFGDWDWSAAEAHFRRALHLYPGNAWAHLSYSYLLATQRRFDEARLQIDEARALDPLRVDYTIALAAIHIWNGDRELGYEWWKKAEEIDPTYPGLHQSVISSFCGSERHGEALGALEGARTKYPEDPLVLSQIAYCYAVAGNSVRANELQAQVESLTDDMYVSHISRAMVHVGLGEHERALDALERGVRDRDYGALFLGLDGTWDPLRGDPRFEQLLASIGLTGP